KRAVEGADGGSRGADDDDIGHGFLLLAGLAAEGFFDNTGRFAAVPESPCRRSHSAKGCHTSVSALVPAIMPMWPVAVRRTSHVGMARASAKADSGGTMRY